ncbi:MAG TPA: acyl-CoA dehydrogenase family protein [Vicinamibacteria bacterium]|nr:acyl-CoA dehydrogenase family protein [Vicinamibacteria bacterium]
MNFFTDNDDLQFHFSRGVAWDRIVPLWEEGFRFEDGPRALDEARELYHDTLRETGEYAAREIAPRAREIDEEGVSFVDGRVVHPAALLRNIEGLKRLGVMGMNLPRDLGGSNFPFSAGTMLFEMLSRACTNTCLLYAFHQAPAVPILRFGTREQARRWVPRLASGEISGSVAMTEPDAGSDVGAVSTTAVPEGGHWRITGRKQFITNGSGDVSVVLARTEPGSRGLEGLSLLVAPRLENGRDNFRVARPENKNVIRGSATCELSFEGSCAELLGPRGAGFAQILTFMNEARLAVAIQGLGIAEAAGRAARAYAERRVQMGKPIARHEMVADLLLDMEAETAALRALVYRCTELQDRIIGLERRPSEARPGELAGLKRELRDRTPLVKWLGAERTLWVARAAVQVHGGYGVVREYDVERHYRDALILPIYEGTSQIQALMSLKDQARWVRERPWRVFTGAVAVEASPDVLGDAVRDLAAEYNRTLRHVLLRSGGLGAMVARRLPADEDLAFARLHAERLTAMLAHVRAAEALAAHAPASARHRRLAERFVSRALPLLRMYGDVVRSGDLGALEAVRA